MAYKNPEDQKIASRKHYLANKEKYLSRNRLYRKSIQQFVRDLKESKKCTDCGNNFPYYVMDFDHVDDKKAGVNYLMSTGRIGALKKEIEKCEVVCANCHRIRTHIRSQKTLKQV